jgi:hypothetical protein
MRKTGTRNTTPSKAEARALVEQLRQRAAIGDTAAAVALIQLSKTNERA